jgi:PKD repeat protein
MSCGGGGGQSYPAPTLANLTLVPAAVYAGSGNGKATVQGSASFMASGSTLTAATITILDGSGKTVSTQNVPIQGAGASGTLMANASVTTTNAGSFTVQVYATNAAGQNSNTVSAAFTISPVPWTQGPSMPTPRYNSVVVTINSKFYVLGGELVA